MLLLHLRSQQVLLVRQKSQGLERTAITQDEELLRGNTRQKEESKQKEQVPFLLFLPSNVPLVGHVDVTTSWQR